jgi:error-prone DNA polymerase
MVAIHGKLQKEGQVIHVISERLEDLTPLLAAVGEMQFPYRAGPADGARHGGPDPRTPRDPLPALAAARDGGLRIQSRNFQ